MTGFSTPAVPGTGLSIRIICRAGQTYLAGQEREHRRRDGQTTTLVEWRSNCADCGRPFTFWTTMPSTHFWPNRRCEIHKRPGVRVKQSPRTGAIALALRAARKGN